MLIENITIDHFMEAWFKKNYEHLSEQDFETAYCEYMDVSGLYKSKQFEKLSYINYLSIRVTSLRTAINVERDFLEATGEPYQDGFFFFKKYGYKLFWNGNKEQFLEYLSKIEKKEKKFETDLVAKQKVFIAEQQKKVSEQKTLMQTRHEFIRNLNVLQKNGYVINRKTTFVEELCLMMKESLEDKK